MSGSPPSAETRGSVDGGSPPFVCAQTGFGILEVTGSDAAEFLHGQLSSDVRALATGSAQYSSYNSAKGRVLANLLLFRVPGDGSAPRFGMVLAAALAGPIRERLARYVLRANVAIVDRSSDWAMFGLLGGDASRALAGGGVVLAPLAVAEKAGALVLGFADGRALALGPPAAVAALRDVVAAGLQPADGAAWTRADIDAGIAWVVPATSDRFVAQMLNWDVIGGISFRKGCYPGQEIVARMQYLGRLKERLLAFGTARDDVAPGAPLTSPGFGDQSCGTVAVAAPGPDGGTRMLAVVQLAAAEADDLSVGGHPAAKLVRMPLPYPLPPASRQS